MARLPRLVVPGEAHYLILRAHSALGEPGLFVDAEDRSDFLSGLREAAHAEGVALHAYALQAREVQLLATPQHPAALGRMLQALGRRFVSAHNRRHHRRGALWDGRFRGAVVEPGAWRLAALRLIDGPSDETVGNSAGHRCGGTRDAALSDPPEFWRLGNTPFEREAAYRELLAHALPLELVQGLRRASLGGWAAGSQDFAERVAQSAARPASPRPRGRPRRSAA